MRSGSRCCPFPPFNALHGRRYWRLRALSFLLKAGSRRSGPGRRPPPRPGRHPPCPPVPPGPVPARHRPCKAPVASPLGPGRFPAGPWLPFPTGVSQGPAGSRSTWREPVRCLPRQRPGTTPSPRPRGPPAGPGLGPPSCPSPGVLPIPPMRSRRGRCPDVPSAVRQVPRRFPSYGCMRSEPPRHQQLFFKFFHEFFRLRPAWCFRT